MERNSLTGPDGTPSGQPQMSYETVEGDDLEGAMTSFLARSDAVLVGSIQKFPGFTGMATARDGAGLFVIYLSPVTRRA